jgi:DNA-binding SARP family transcriptional activator
MSFEFRVLGPVEVVQDRQRVAIGPPIRVAMVAAMALAANRPIPLSRLAAAMWPDSPPPSATANIRTHVSALRPVLGGRLVTRSGAYELRIDGAELDAAQFDHHATAGRRALEAGDYPAANAHLDAALGLWRGTAGDGLHPGTSLAAQLANLEARRWSAFEDQMEARLHTGGYADATTDLRRNLVLDPVRERSWALLMQALYRSGDTSGALDAYRRARAALQEHLGVEPGPALQQLHRAILNREAWLDDPSGHALVAGAPPDPPTTSAVPRPRPACGPEQPRHLPTVTTALYGRDALLESIAEHLRDRTDVVAYGRAGVGASALGMRAAHLVSDAFPDGLIAIDARDDRHRPRTPHRVLAAALRELGHHDPGSGPDALHATYLELVRGRRILILLDNVVSDAQTFPLRTAAGPIMLTTSRGKILDQPGAWQVAVAPLTRDAARQMLAGHAGRARVAEEPEAMDRLVELCDGLPLALRIAGERLVRRPQLPLSVLMEHLANRPLEGLQLGRLSMRRSLAAGLDAIATENALTGAVFRELGALPAGTSTTPQALADDLSEDTSRVFYALESLVDAGLADSPQAAHYLVRGLTHAYAAELARRESCGSPTGGRGGGAMADR